CTANAACTPERWPHEPISTTTAIDAIARFTSNEYALAFESRSQLRIPRVVEAVRAIQGLPFGRGVQLDGPHAPLPEPREDRLEHGAGVAAPPELRFRHHPLDVGEPSGRDARAGESRGDGHAAAG